VNPLGKALTRSIMCNPAVRTPPLQKSSPGHWRDHPFPEGGGAEVSVQFEARSGEFISPDGGITPPLPANQMAA